MSLIREYMGTDEDGILWYWIRFGPVALPADLFNKIPTERQAFILSALGIPPKFVKDTATQPDSPPTL